MLFQVAHWVHVLGETGYSSQFQTLTPKILYLNISMCDMYLIDICAIFSVFIIKEKGTSKIAFV